jgi:hypothetical protein
VLLRIKAIAKQLIHIISAELSGRQTDAVNNQQRNIILIRAFIAIGRNHLTGAIKIVLTYYHLLGSPEILELIHISRQP